MRTIHRLTIGVAAVAVLATIATVPAVAASDPVTPPTTNIVGGTDAVGLHGAVSVQVPDGRHFCGGSLILARVVVTAAHCGVLITAGQTRVRAGSPFHARGGEVATVVSAVYHPDFTGEYGGGDVAVLHLDRPIRSMRPIPIARTSGGPGTPTMIAGWGRTCETPDNPVCDTVSPRLQQLRTLLMPASACRMPHPDTGIDIFNAKHELCTRSRSGEPEMACHGDSGGPQTRLVNGREHLIGVTSRDGDDLIPHLNDCTTGPDGTSAGVGVWTDITTYRLWIYHQTTRGNRAAVAEWTSIHGPVPLT